jgi:surfeit locus 1 family protein
MNSANRVVVLLRALTSRRWLLSTLAVLLGMILLARLGIWQLDRLEQRRAQNQELRLALAAPPIRLAEGNIPDDLTNRKDHAVIVEGEYDISRQIILKLQYKDGQPGVHLVTPLLITGSNSALLVDRGWIPQSSYASDRGASFDITGLATVNGYIGLSQTLSRPATGAPLPDTPQREWYRIDIAAIQAQMPYPLLPIYVYQAPSPGGNTLPPLRQERDVDLSEGPHLGYAVQWFIFSLLLGIVYVVYVNKRTVPSRRIV